MGCSCRRNTRSLRGRVARGRRRCGRRGQDRARCLAAEFLLPEICFPSLFPREHLFRICCLQNPELQGALRICKACGWRGLSLTPHDGNIPETWPRTEAPGEGGREDEQRDGKVSQATGTRRGDARLHSSGGPVASFPSTIIYADW